MADAVTNAKLSAAHLNNVTFKGWLRFNGTGTISLIQSFNVDSLTDFGVGNYSVSWSANFSARTYCMVVSANVVAGSITNITGTDALFEANCRIQCNDETGAAQDSNEVHGIALGVSEIDFVPNDLLTSTQINESTSKGWIMFNGTGTVAIGESYNVTSLTDNGVGDYTITWGNDFITSSYSFVANANVDASTIVNVAGTDLLLAPSARINCNDETGAAQDSAEVYGLATGESTNDIANGTILTASVLNTIGVQGWIRFNGTDTILIRESFNIDSITDLGTGQYGILWDVDFTGTGPDTYCVITSANVIADGITNIAGTTATFRATFNINCKDNGGVLQDSNEVHAVATGIQ